MAQDITLLGATYNDVPAVELPKSGGGTASFTDVSDTTATASDVASGKNFFNALGALTTGTGSLAGQYDQYGLGAEYLGVLSTTTINLSSDTSFDTWSASTTATTIKTSAGAVTLTNQELDLGTYTYLYLANVVSDIKFKSGATLKSVPWLWVLGNWGMVYYYQNSYTDYINGTRSTVGKTTIAASGQPSLFYYYSNGTPRQYYTSYGPMYSDGITVNTTTSGGKTYLTLNAGNVKARCNSTYFATARKDDIDSANTNMTITVELYRIRNGQSLPTMFYDKYAEYL